MTTSPSRRRRNTVTAAVLAVVGLVVIGAVTAVGAATLADSRAGRDVTAGGGVPQLELPVTSTALLAVTDDDGTLTSTLAMVLTPEGIGGSVVVIPASADGSFARAGDVVPLAESLASEGPQAMLTAVEALTSISYDVAEIARPARLEALLSPLGAVTIVVPEGLPDDVDLVAGDELTLSVADAVDLLTLTTTSGPDSQLDPLRILVWTGLASSVGAGTGAADPADVVASPVPADLDEFMTRLTSGRVGVRELRTTVPAVDENPREVDAVSVDRAELLLVFGQIAPSRVAAPNDSLTFRIEAHFSDEQLAPFGVNNADVARDLIQILLFLRANVVSVETSSRGAPAVSEAAVADRNLIVQVADGWSELFGDVTVEPAEVQIAGIDATVVLGESYLTYRAERLMGGDDLPSEEDTDE